MSEAVTDQGKIVFPSSIVFRRISVLFEPNKHMAAKRGGPETTVKTEHLTVLHDRSRARLLK